MPPMSGPGNRRPTTRHDRRHHHRPLIEIGAGDRHVGAEHRQRDGDELHRRLPFAEHRRVEPNAARGDGGAQAEDGELAGDDDQRHPRRRPMDGDQPDQRGGDQQLVAVVSRNDPSVVVTFQRRASRPSNQSVAAATRNRIAAIV